MHRDTMGGICEWRESGRGGGGGGGGGGKPPKREKTNSKRQSLWLHKLL